MKRWYHIMFNGTNRKNVLAEDAVDACQILCEDQKESSPEAGWNVFVSGTRELVKVRFDGNTKKGRMVWND